MKNTLGSWIYPAKTTAPPAPAKPQSKPATTKGKPPVLAKSNIPKKAPHPDEEIIFTPTVILTTGLLASVAMAGVAHYAWDVRHSISPEGTRYLYGAASVLAIGCSGVLALRFFGIALQRYREQAERSTKALEHMNADELQIAHRELIADCIRAVRAARASNDRDHKAILGRRTRVYVHKIQFIEKFLQERFNITIKTFAEQHRKTKAQALESTGKQAPLNAQDVESAVADSTRRLMEEGWPLNSGDMQITKIHREIEQTRASIVEAFIVFAGMEVWKLSEAQASGMASAIALECMQMVTLEQSRPSIEESPQETPNTTPIAHAQKQRMALEVLSNTYRIYIRPTIEQQLKEKTVIQDGQDPHKCRRPDRVARIEKALSSSREQLWRTLETDKYRNRTDLVQINNALQGLVQEIVGRGIHTPTEQLEQVQTRLKDIPAENDQSLMRIIAAIRKALDDIQVELAKPILKQASGDVTGVTKEITRLRQILNNSSGTTAKIAQAIRALPEPQAPTAS